MSAADEFVPEHFRNAVSSLAEALDLFRQSLSSEPFPPIWARPLPESRVVNHSESLDPLRPEEWLSDSEGHQARKYVLDAVMSITYRDDQHPKVVRRWAGVVPVTASTMGCARMVNAAKLRLAAELQKARGPSSQKLQQSKFNDRVQAQVEASELRRILGPYSGGRLQIVQDEEIATP